MKELKNLEIFTRELIWFRIENIYDDIAVELGYDYYVHNGNIVQ